MPEDLPGDPCDGVVSKFWLGFVFPGRVLLWRALRVTPFETLENCVISIIFEG